MEAREKQTKQKIKMHKKKQFLKMHGSCGCFKCHQYTLTRKDVEWSYRHTALQLFFSICIFRLSSAFSKRRKKTFFYASKLKVFHKKDAFFMIKWCVFCAKPSVMTFKLQFFICTRTLKWFQMKRNKKWWIWFWNPEWV